MSAAREAISNGSKSFYFASLFFPAVLREQVWALYSWCRHCDDQVDHARAPAEAREAVQRLWAQTVAAFKGEEQPQPFAGLGQICRRHRVPLQYPVELLTGFAKDAANVRYRNLSELEGYAYHVAGAVGAMMASIMGARGEALPHAVAMGNAMQLTNIARDVREDYSRGRVYLPQEWLAAADLAEERLFADGERLFVVVCRVLDRADELYARGFGGLKFLPLRCAIAVAAAAEIYSAIGKKIRRLGPAALGQRVYVGIGAKIWLSVKGLARALRSRV